MDQPNKKIRVGILGAGNIASDLLYKIQRSPYLECTIVCGRDPDSPGLKIAKEMGIQTAVDATAFSIAAIQENPDICDIVFDATSAKGHTVHAPILKQLGKLAIDLTPARIGEMCIPALDLDERLVLDNVNMVTCGGQATTPIAKAIMQVHPETTYIEVVGSIASRSAGPGTRVNIDEYTQTTKDAIETYSGVPKAKAIIILNPAEPEVWMYNTIYASIQNPDIPKLTEAVAAVEKEMQKYVPGYKVMLWPTYNNGRVCVSIQVEGAGDFLPKYSGNLDIMTSAAVRIAEGYAKKKLHIDEGN